MFSPKLIVTDLDGTALRSDKTVSQTTREAFARWSRAGVPIAIATARYLAGAAPYASALSADFQILTDGTLIYYKGELIYSNAMSLETTNHILCLLRQAGYVSHIAAPTTQGLFRYPGSNSSGSPGIPFDINAPFPYSANKIVAELPCREEAERIARLCGCHQFHYRREPRYAFYSATAGKLDALRKITQRLHITLEDVLVFGDDINDKEMIASCGMGVAMGNALPELKELADAVTGTNQADGVALFLNSERLLLPTT